MIPVARLFLKVALIVITVGLVAGGASPVAASPSGVLIQGNQWMGGKE